MEGLEISEISKSQLLQDNESFRLDSEFNLKSHRIAIRRLCAIGAEKFEDSLPEIIHPHEIERQYAEDGGVWFFRAQNGRPLQIDDTDKVYISEGDAKLLPRNKLKQADVLITRTGANRGDCSYFNSPVNAVASSHTLIVRSNKWKHEFLVAFFNSYYGKAQIDKGVYGAVQPQIAPYYLRKIWIPRFSNEFQESIKKMFELAGGLRQRSNESLHNAEQVLLSALDLEDWAPSEPLTYTRRASEACIAGRIDAEYFHPAKKAFIDRLRSQPGKPLEAHYEAIREMFDPKSANAGEVVRNFDLPDALQPVLDDEKGTMFASEVGSLKKSFSAGDVVISRLRAYLREIALVRTSAKVPSVGSSEFIVLRPRNEENPKLSRAALMVFLRSHPVQTILKWSQDGSHHPRFSDEALLNIPVPDVVCNVAPKIERLFDEILSARTKSRALLEKAKRAVEIAIEDSEAAAIKYLKEI